MRASPRRQQQRRRRRRRRTPIHKRTSHLHISVSEGAGKPAKKAKPAPVAAEPTETAEEALTNGCTKINTRLKVFPLDMRLRWINDPKADIFQ